jgi:hypothetical protein
MFTLVIQALKAFLANLAANIALVVMEALRRTTTTPP